jgi:hypothetical protein
MLTLIERPNATQPERAQIEALIKDLDDWREKTPRPEDVARTLLEKVSRVVDQLDPQGMRPPHVMGSLGAEWQSIGLHIADIEDGARRAVAMLQRVLNHGYLRAAAYPSGAQQLIDAWNEKAQDVANTVAAADLAKTWKQDVTKAVEDALGALPDGTKPNDDVKRAILDEIQKHGQSAWNAAGRKWQQQMQAAAGAKVADLHDGWAKHLAKTVIPAALEAPRSNGLAEAAGRIQTQFEMIADAMDRNSHAAWAVAAAMLVVAVLSAWWLLSLLHFDKLVIALEAATALASILAVVSIYVASGLRERAQATRNRALQLSLVQDRVRHHGGGVEPRELVTLEARLVERIVLAEANDKDG